MTERVPTPTHFLSFYFFLPGWKLPPCGDESKVRSREDALVVLFDLLLLLPLYSIKKRERARGRRLCDGECTGLTVHRIIRGRETIIDFSNRTQAWISWYQVCFLVFTFVPTNSLLTLTPRCSPSNVTDTLLRSCDTSIIIVLLSFFRLPCSACMHMSSTLHVLVPTCLHTCAPHVLRHDMS